MTEERARYSTGMNLPDARKRLREIEATLGAEIQRQMDGFQAEFGVPITDVFVTMIDVTTVGSRGKEFRAAVRCRVEL